MLKKMVDKLPLAFKGSKNINLSNTGLDILSLYKVFICKMRNSGFSGLKMEETSTHLIEIPEYFAAQLTWLPASSTPGSVLYETGLQATCLTQCRGH
jgi:hypothetical protein